MLGVAMANCLNGNKIDNNSSKLSLQVIKIENT